MPAEQQLWEGKPSLKVLVGDFVWAVLYAVVLALAVAFLFPLALDTIGKMSEASARAIALNAPGLHLAAVLFVVVVAGQRLVRVGWKALVLRGNSYRLSNQRLLVESGVFSRTIDEIDLRTVDDITFHQRFFERMLGLARVGIVASEPGRVGGALAGRGRTVVELVGIADPRAVREQIRNAAYEASGKQVFMRQA